jgi:Acetyltransferase (GNAT) domain
LVLKSSTFRPTTIADEARLVQFLARAFSVGTQAAFLDSALMRWKYWTPREDYPEARSYVLERNGEITAHAGVWPLSIRTEGICARGAHMIDWASDASAPGSGAALVQRLIRQFDFMYSIGGSSMTQNVLPAFGFKEVTQAWLGVRPLRPLRQMLFHQTRNWKLPVRLARNAWWSVVPMPRHRNGWSAAEASADEFDPPVCCQHSPGFFRYIEQCPTIHLRLYRLLAKGAEEGWFALSVIQKQARIAGVWLKNASSANWRSAYLATQEAAGAIAETCEISAAGSAGASEMAAQDAGFRIVRREPVYLLQKTGAPLMPFEFQLADNDEFFLSSGGPAFLS